MIPNYLVLKRELRSKGPATDVVAILVADAYPLKGYAEELVWVFQAHTGTDLVHSDGILSAVGSVAEAPLWNIALKDVIRTHIYSFFEQREGCVAADIQASIEDAQVIAVIAIELILSCPAQRDTPPQFPIISELKQAQAAYSELGHRDGLIRGEVAASPQLYKGFHMPICRYEIDILNPRQCSKGNELIW